MKTTFSKIKGLVVMAFASVISFLSKAMGQAIDNGWDSQQGFYGVYMPTRGVSVAESPEPSSFSSIIDTAVKYFEFVLFAAIFIVGLVSFLKIRKIEDKELRSKKIKKTLIAIAVLFVVGLLVLLGYWLYYRIFMPSCCASPF